MARDDGFDRNVRRALGQPQADDLVDAAAATNGTPRQIALARVRAMMAYLSEIDDAFSHPPVRALPDDEPLYRLAEVDRLWERFYEICSPESEPASVVEFLEIIDDVAGKADHEERQLAQLQDEVREGVLAPQVLNTLAGSLGYLLREMLDRRDFKLPNRSDEELGTAVLLWRRQRGDRYAKGKKWDSVLELAREAGFYVQSPEALKMTWVRRELRRLSDNEVASLREQISRNAKNTEQGDL